MPAGYRIFRFSASDHDPYVVISGNNVYAFSGTSAGAPVFAGVMALFNQTLALSGPGWPGAGNINPLLYRKAAEQPSAFHDITTGDNIVPCTYGTPDCVNGSLGYSVGPGYDPVTGLGTVNVGELLNLHVSTRTTVTVPASVMVEGQLTVTVTVATQVVPSPNPAGLGQGSVMLYQNGAYKSTANVVGGVAAIPVTLSPGTYTLTATYGGNYSFAASTSAPVTFLVTPNAPAPALLAPANQSAALPDAVQLKWNGASYATSYDVYLGAASPPPFWGSTASFNSTATGMAPSTTYYWRVVANTRNGPVPSPIWSFTTAPRAYTISTLGEVPAPGDVVLDRNGNVYVADQAYCRVRMITPAGIISIVAGSGCLPSNSPDSGDGGPATAASLWSVSGLAIDSQGNFYISSRNRIRKVAPSGVISTFAGSGAFGYSGDGGPPASAELASPTGLAVDGAGNLYIADTANYCVRKISAGIIFTVAGQCGHPGTAGDGHAAIDAELSGPNGLAVDSAGNLYIADTSSIRKVSNGVITTVAGGSAAYPLRVAVDGSGNVLFTSGHFVYELANGSIGVIAGDVSGLGLDPGDREPAASVTLSRPFGIAVGSAGLVYVTDADLAVSRILVLTPFTAPLSPTIASGGVLNAASFAAGPVAPGSIASVFGSFGLLLPAQATSVPLPPALTGFSMRIGGSNAPLFYASGRQANVQIPWEFAGQSTGAMAAALNGITGPTQTVQLAPFAPAIFSVNGLGTGQGVITDTSYRPADSANPASAGANLQIYSTGLGAVTNPPPSGTPATATALSRTVSTPTVTIGGLPAPVSFSGLVPGTVGEYQINVQVPAGVTAGLAVPVVLSIGGASSNTVTIAVK